MAMPELVPSRLAPWASMVRASPVERTPPEAFTPISGPTAWRMRAMSAAVAALPAAKPVAVF